MSRNYSLDILKLSMAFMVVGLHAGFLGDFTLLGEYLAVNGLFRIAVPVFLIINGFYFYPVLAKGGQRGWLKRVLILYCVWMVFYSYFWFSVPDMSVMGAVKLVKDVVIGYHHLWYISGMLGAAVMLIVLHHFSSKFLLISVIILFFAGVLIQYFGNYHYYEQSILDKLFNQHWFHRNAFFLSYPFFCIGYLIHKHSIHERVTFDVAVFASALGLLALFGEAYLNFYQEGRDGGFDNYISLLLVCPSVFIMFVKSSIPGKGKNIALYSSGVYFIHSFFLSVFGRFSDLKATSLAIVVILISVVASYFIIKINERIRVLL